MRCPTLTNLPPPPEGKTGWPWTEESPQLPLAMPDGSAWPKISIVTPSFNQGKYIEETIRSVLLQGYPDLEYIIIDGNSTDNTLDLIAKYERWLAYWVSEPDDGQANAINKGFRRTTGEIVAWLNSDDLYTRKSFCNVAQWFSKDESVLFIYGDCAVVNEKGERIDYYKGRSYQNQDFRAYWKHFVPQPSAFFHRKILHDIGLLDETLNFILDYDFWLRISQNHWLYYCGEQLAAFRLHQSSKTVSFRNSFAIEMDMTIKKYWGKPFSLTYCRFLFERDKYRSGVLRWKAYESYLRGDRKKCSRLLLKSLATCPLFFLDRKYFSVKNLRNRYFPFILEFFSHRKPKQIQS